MEPKVTTDSDRRVYRITDREGRLVAEHHHVRKGGDKECFWRQPSGEWGLNGTPLADLPLYGVDELPDAPPVLTVVVEGEKSRDALANALQGVSDVCVVGTVTGASQTPGLGTLECLRGHDVVLWPDADDPGRAHMERVAEGLQGIALAVRVYDWPEAPEKGDAADHPTVISGDETALDRLLNDLCGAPRYAAPELASDGPNGSDNGARDRGQPTHDELRDRYIAVSGDAAYGLGEWRRYENGIWHPVPELTAKRGICEVIEAAKPEGIKPTNSLLTSVTELTRVKVAVADEQWDADPDVLVCGNGALRISTRVLEPHRREHYATSAVPYDYDPEANPVIWNYFVNNAVPDAAAFLQEFAGYALTTEMGHEVALWLFGPPGSGKSTCLAGLQAMLGHRAGLLGLAEIERNRFALAGLPGKTLVAASEQPSSYLASTNVLNAIISGEPLQVERKYRDPVTVIPRCKIAWAMNELPRVADANSGLFRRVKVVKFPQIPANERDPKIRRAIEREGAGILNWALEGLERLQRRGGFAVPEGVEEATEQFRENNDVPALFVADRCVKDPDASEKASTLYGAYADWCKDNGHRAQSSTRLADDWQRLGFERYRSKGTTRYKGVRLRMAGDD
jgi:putative DNA primase/helicase